MLKLILNPKEHCQFRILIVWTDFIIWFHRIFDWFCLNANCSTFFVYVFTFLKQFSFTFWKNGNINEISERKNLDFEL